VDETTRKNRAAAYRTLGIGAAITALLSLLLLFTAGRVAAYSAALGGLAYLLPNAYFVKYAFRYSAADSAELAVRGFYIGEAVKVLGTVLIFIFSFVLIKQLNMPALFLTFALMWILNLRGLYLLMHR